MHDPSAKVPELSVSIFKELCALAMELRDKFFQSTASSAIFASLKSNSIAS